MPFTFQRLEIPDVLLVEPKVHKDERGFFIETYKFSEFAAFGIEETFMQDNHSRSTRLVLRGLHFQKKNKGQAKIVRATAGEIFDVAVDIRHGSPTFGKWVGAILSQENRKQMVVPAGFAHGFCILSETAEVLYKTTEEYSPQHEKGILWNDPDIGIRWPISNPNLSPKDAVLPQLKEIDTGFYFK